tara:strand:- start:1487 stop:2284 length:798 start_codon:yes stop_codon:yes gene_type:complete
MRDTIAVYSLFRDSEPHLARTLAQFEDLESLDYNFEYYFYENDSKDNTVAILEDWLKNREHKFRHENLTAKKFGSVTSVERMKFLCECRNKCKDLLKESRSKYTIMIDSDVIFNKNNLRKHIKTIEEIDDCILITPNIRQNIPDLMYGVTEDSYYDVYPFFDSKAQHGLCFTDCPFRNGLDRMRWGLGQLVKCASSFGGFALTRTGVLNKVKWSTDGLCDHVNWCKDINQYGSIYVDPLNKVSVNLDLTLFNINSLKEIAKQQTL